jgi:hypothetical protein
MSRQKCPNLKGAADGDYLNEKLLSAEAGHRKRTGRWIRTESGGPGGTSRQHTAKSSIHYKPGMYTRRSCAERCVFTPGDLPRVHKD